MIQTLILLFILFHPNHSKPDYLKLNLHYTGNHLTPSQILVQDSIRLSSLSSRATLSAPIISGASSGSGQYLVEFHLGNPPQPLHLIADTGSDLIWTRCSPCHSNCSFHHPPGTTFLPRHSTTFSPFHCYSPSCHLIPHPSHFCNHTRLHSPCRYRYSYADSSSTSGFFSHDVATLHTLSGHPTHIPNLPFGCAFNISPGPALSSAHGVLGLGRGPISFPSHTSSYLGNLFSYCLLDYTLSPPPTSFLLIGHHSIKPSFTSNLSFTPLLSNPLSPTFYYIHITTVYLNNIRLPINPDIWALDPHTGNGGTIIDSGTTMTFLPAPAYEQILSAMARKILHHLKISHGPPGFDLCVNSTKALRRPKLAFKLLGGAVLTPPPGNYFIEAAEGVSCLALQPADAGFGVFGNLMQQGFLLVFDRDASRLGFSRNGCGV